MNRVFRDKQGGLIVDYLGRADQLKQALATYTESGGQGRPAELVASVCQSTTIDWTVRESARAKIRVMVRRILKKDGYPPDLQEEGTKLVMEQAEVLCADWAT